MATSSSQARRRLDARLQRIDSLAAEPRPHKGWIRAIRDALGMSGTELAARIGVTQPAIISIERSELHDTIKLETLRRAAEALDCELVYFLIPRTTLEESVERQARQKAAQYLQRVVHHSRLEDQATTNEESAEQLDELAAQLIERRGLWSESSGSA